MCAADPVGELPNTSPQDRGLLRGQRPWQSSIEHVDQLWRASWNRVQKRSRLPATPASACSSRLNMNYSTTQHHRSPESRNPTPRIQGKCGASKKLRVLRVIVTGASGGDDLRVWRRPASVVGKRGRCVRFDRTRHPPRSTSGRDRISSFLCRATGMG